MKPIQTLSPYPIITLFHITTRRGLSFGPKDNKSGLTAMPEGTEREAGPKLTRQKYIT